MTCHMHPHVSIVLLAAGGASRFGSAKQVIPIDGTAMVRHCARNAMNSGAPIAVVTGAHREKVDDVLRDLDVTTIHNAGWNLGMGSTIACGVGVATQNPGVEAVIILLADQPLVSGDDLRDLISHYRKQPDRIIAASANGTIMPPCLFPRSYFPELLTLRDQSGARAVLQRYADRIVAVPMPNAAVDIDTKEAYAQFCASRPLS
jgi:molybdenum cofactor cytidylyltransferase